MCDILHLAGVAPAADDAVGGAWVDAEGCGGFGVGLAVELCRKCFEELALLEGGSCGSCRGGGLSRVGFREGEEDVGVVAEDYGGHRHSALIVGVEAGQSVLNDAVLHYAEGGEDHRETKRYQAEAADGGYKLVSAAVAVLGLPGGEPSVEVSSLDWCEGEADVLGLFEDGVEVVELLTKCLKMFVKRGVGVGAEHVVPDKAEIKEVEDETAEQTVLGIGYEVQDLSGCPCQERGKTWGLDVHIFTVLAADV